MSIIAIILTMSETFQNQQPDGNESRTLLERASDSINKRLINLGNRIGLSAEDKGARAQLAITVGVVGGIATHFLAPELTGHIIDTVQSQGANYLQDPGMGEII